MQVHGEIRAGDFPRSPATLKVPAGSFLQNHGSGWDEGFFHPSATASDWTGRCVAGEGGGGWMDRWVGRGVWGRRPRQRVLSENNNSGDLGAYTFKAGPAPPRARPSVCRGVALVAGLRELDSLSPQALREAQEAEDCKRSGLARRVGSEVSAASRGGSSAGCSRWDRRPHLSAFLKCCWVLTSGGEMDPTEPQTPKTQTREARSRLWKGRGPGGRCQEEFLCAALFPGIQSLLLE